jgi:hypothetical protein
MTPYTSISRRSSPILRRFNVFIDTKPAVGLDALLAALGALPPATRISVVNVRLHSLAPADEGVVRRFDARLAALGKTVLRALTRVKFHLPLVAEVVTLLGSDPEATVSTTSVSLETFISWLPRQRAVGRFTESKTTVPSIYCTILIKCVSFHVIEAGRKRVGKGVGVNAAQQWCQGLQHFLVLYGNARVWALLSNSSRIDVALFSN